MIGVLIPVHNEAQLLGRCLDSIEKAAHHPFLGNEPVETVVVLDRCSDGSEEIARRYAVHVTHIEAGNVGQARAHGAEFLIDRGARWIASTDADSRVGQDWLVMQLMLQSDLVCGTVRIDDDVPIPADCLQKYHSGYQYAEGHRHIHGANLGFSSELYLLSGGFAAAEAHEDVNFVRNCQELNARIAWSNLPQVFTSARLHSRVQGGFADFLRKLVENTEKN